MTAPGQIVRRILLLIGLALFAYLLYILGPRQILSTLLELRWNFLGVVLIFAIQVLFRAAALHRCIGRDGVCSFWDALQIRLSGEAVHHLTFTGPLLAEPSRAWFLKKKGLPAEEAVSAVLSEFLIHTFTSAGLTVFGLGYLILSFPLNRALFIAAIVVIFATTLFLLTSATAIIFRIYLIGRVVDGVTRLPLLRARRPDMRRVRDMEDLLLQILRGRPARFAAIVLLELTAQALLIIELAWIFESIGFEMPWSHLFAIEGGVKFTGAAFFFIPAQVGVAEGVYIALAKALSLPSVVGFTVSFVRRLRSLVVAALGFATFWFLSSD